MRHIKWAPTSGEEIHLWFSLDENPTTKMLFLEMLVFLGEYHFQNEIFHCFFFPTSCLHKTYQTCQETSGNSIHKVSGPSAWVIFCFSAKECLETLFCSPKIRLITTWGGKGSMNYSSWHLSPDPKKLWNYANWTSLIISIIGKSNARSWCPEKGTLDPPSFNCLKYHGGVRSPHGK